jgi:crotonobetaine/carnitine-CoA ligase
MATYPGFVPTVADRREWTLPRVLARRAQTHGERVFLQVPSSGVTLTYAQIWALAKKVASGLLSDGHAPGDRLVIMMENNAEYILAWFGSALAGLAEVPVCGSPPSCPRPHPGRSARPSCARTASPGRSTGAYQPAAASRISRTATRSWHLTRS